MTQKIPRHIIIDLLPLYLSDEVSEETRELIEEQLKEDNTLAKLVEKAKQNENLQEIPAPLNKETEMKSFKKGKNLMIQHNVFLALAILFTLVVAHSYIFAWETGRGMIIFFTIMSWYAFSWANDAINE